MTCRRAVYILGCEGQRSRSQNRICPFSNFSVIYHSKFLNIRWLIVLDKGKTRYQFREPRIKVKVTKVMRRQPRRSSCIPFSLLLESYRWNQGDYRFPHSLPVSLSVRQLCVCPLGFPNFSSRYGLEIWCMNFSWDNTDQAWVLSCLTYFYESYCPLLKFSFPNFSLSSFEILIWNLVYELVMT